MDFMTVSVQVFTIISLVVASSVALQGFDMWKKQQTWKYDRELAQRTLRAIYGVREAITYYRSFVISAGEKTDAVRDAQKRTPEVNLEDVGEFVLIYQRRWRRLAKQNKQLAAVLLEVEAAWGKDVKAKIMGVEALVTRLYASTGVYLEMHEVSRKQRVPLFNESTEALYWQSFNDIFSSTSSGDSDNEFDLSLGAAIADAESELFKKLEVSSKRGRNGIR